MRFQNVLGLLLACTPYLIFSQDCTISFPDLDPVALDGGEMTITGGATPQGGVYSGPGVTDNSNGQTFNFDPAVTGSGEQTISYTYSILGDWALISGSNLMGETNDNNSFGFKVDYSADGTRAVVSALSNSEVAANSGQIRVYDWDGTSWTQVGQDISGPDSGDSLGDNVVITPDGSRIAIGILGFFGRARVEVYDWNGTSWVQVGTDITQTPGLSFDFFFGRGLSISDNGNRLAIGGEGNAAVTYEWNGLTWIQIGSPLVGDRANDRFGATVDLSPDGNRLAVAANENNISLSNRRGYIKIYDWNGSDWVQVGNTVFGDADQSYLGSTMDLSANGIRFIASHNFSSRVYEYDGANWVQIGSDIASAIYNVISDDGNRIATASGSSLSIYDWSGTTWAQVDGSVTASFNISSLAIPTAGTPILVGGSNNIGLFQQEEDCSEMATVQLLVENPIPTMSQWMLFILSLLITTIGLVNIKKQQLAA